MELEAVLCASMRLRHQEIFHELRYPFPVHVDKPLQDTPFGLLLGRFESGMI